MMKVSIRPDHCIALRLIASQEKYRKSQDWLNMVPEWERLVEVAGQSQAIIKMQAAEIEKLRAALSELVGAASRVNMRTGTEFYTAWRAAYDITKAATIEQSSIVQSPAAAALKETGK